jgi:hypothetical protein
MFLNRFNVQISKIIFFKKKHHFNAFLSKKYFESQLQSQFQTGNSKSMGKIF